MFMGYRSTSPRARSSLTIPALSVVFSRYIIARRDLYRKNLPAKMDDAFGRLN